MRNQTNQENMINKPSSDKEHGELKSTKTKLEQTIENLRITRDKIVERLEYLRKIDKSKHIAEYTALMTRLALILVFLTTVSMTRLDKKNIDKNIMIFRTEIKKTLDGKDDDTDGDGNGNGDDEGIDINLVERQNIIEPDSLYKGFDFIGPFSSDLNEDEPSGNTLILLRDIESNLPDTINTKFGEENSFILPDSAGVSYTFFSTNPSDDSCTVDNNRITFIGRDISINGPGKIKILVNLPDNTSHLINLPYFVNYCEPDLGITNPEDKLIVPIDSLKNITLFHEVPVEKIYTELTSYKTGAKGFGPERDNAYDYPQFVNIRGMDDYVKIKFISTSTVDGEELQKITTRDVMPPLDQPLVYEKNYLQNIKYDAYLNQFINEDGSIYEDDIVFSIEGHIYKFNYSIYYGEETIINDEPLEDYDININNLISNFSQSNTLKIKIRNINENQEEDEYLLPIEVVNGSTTGIEDQNEIIKKKTELRLFENPTFDGTTTLKIINPESNETINEVKLFITNSLGQQLAEDVISVHEHTDNQTGKGFASEIDLSKYKINASGIYIFRIEYGRHNVTSKLVYQK